VLNLGQGLDYDYIELWGQLLDLLDIWQEVQDRIAELRDKPS